MSSGICELRYNTGKERWGKLYHEGRKKKEKRQIKGGGNETNTLTEIVKMLGRILICKHRAKLHFVYL